MDEKYILELGKILQTMENLASSQLEIKVIMEKNVSKTNEDIKEVKVEIEKHELQHKAEIEKLKTRIVEIEKFKIKAVAYATIISILVGTATRYLPLLLKSTGQGG